VRGDFKGELFISPYLGTISWTRTARLSASGFPTSGILLSKR